MAAVEKWKIIPGYESYRVSNFGRVERIKQSWSTMPKILKPYTITGGYKQVQLFSISGERKVFRVHRLVLELFVRRRKPKEEANHKDGNKENNRASNLELVTATENMKHAYCVGLHGKLHGERSHLSKLKAGEVADIRRFLELGVKCVELARTYQISRHTIYEIRDKQTWRNV